MVLRAERGPCVRLCVVVFCGSLGSLGAVWKQGQFALCLGAVWEQCQFAFLWLGASSLSTFSLLCGSVAAEHALDQPWARVGGLAGHWASWGAAIRLLRRQVPFAKLVLCSHLAM